MGMISGSEITGLRISSTTGGDLLLYVSRIIARPQGSGSGLYPFSPARPSTTFLYSSPHTTDVSCRFQSEATTRLLRCLPFEPDERLDPYDLRSDSRLVSRDYLLSRTHRNGTNILDWVALLVLYCNRSAYVIVAHLPRPDAFPSIHTDFGPYLSFNLNYSAIWAITTELYFFILTPGVTVSRLVTRGSVRNTREI